MAAKGYVILAGETGTNAVLSDLVGTETIADTVGAGEVAIIVDTGAPISTLIVQNSISVLQDLLLEDNKDA